MAYEERRKHASRWRHMGLQLICLACRLLQQMVLTLVKGVGGQIDESLRLQLCGRSPSGEPRKFLCRVNFFFCVFFSILHLTSSRNIVFIPNTRPFWLSGILYKMTSALFVRKFRKQSFISCVIAPKLNQFGPESETLL